MHYNIACQTIFFIAEARNYQSIVWTENLRDLLTIGSGAEAQKRAALVAEASTVLRSSVYAQQG